jgi:AraC family transcriptional regulator of adaptative response/methylated-DNA-[protein]-cysteine methyltransferase
MALPAKPSELLAAQTDTPAKVYWGCHDSPLGPLLMGVTDTGYCRLEFASGYGLAYDLSVWKQEWPETEFVADSSVSASIAMQFREMPTQNWGIGALAIYGSDFQLKVWKALLQIPSGQSASYADIMDMMRGKATRLPPGVTGNLMSMLVPCHRVAMEDGSLSPYRFGPEPEHKTRN